jgi:hypothetical protein
MGKLMKESFEGQCCKRIDGDLAAAPGVTLDVAVQVFKRNALDLQCRKRLLLVPFGNCRRLILREASAGMRKSEAVALGDPVMPVGNGFGG